MLTVLIETRDDEDTLPLTLASLIPGVVEGVVREVIVCDRGSADRTAYVAEHAGCGYLASGGIAAGVRQAKSEWLIFMEPGARLVDGWMDGALTHIAGHAVPARFSPSRDEVPTLLSRLFSRRRPLGHGLLMSKEQAVAATRQMADAAGLARSIRARPLPGAFIRPATLRR